MGLKYKVEVNGISNWLNCGDTVHELDHFVYFRLRFFSFELFGTIWFHAPTPMPMPTPTPMPMPMSTPTPTPNYTV